MRKKVDVVVFDFDGTLSAKDANMEFAKFCSRRSLRPWLFLPVIGFALILRLFAGGQVSRLNIIWREIMRGFLTREMVAKFAPEFIKQHKLSRFGLAKERVASEHSNPDRKVLLISASPDYLVRALVADMKFDAVLCSEMEKNKPWKYKFLCWGENKVVALDEWAQQHKCFPVVVRSYADSKSDIPLMRIAAEQVWIDRRTGLRKNAA